MRRKNFKHCYFIILIASIIASPVTAQQKAKAPDDNFKLKKETDAGAKGRMNLKAVKPLDTLAIERIIGIKGKSNNGEYKITIPQNDLSIMVDGFKIIPAFQCWKKRSNPYIPPPDLTLEDITM